MKRPLQIGDLQGSFLLGKAKRRLYVYFFAIWKVLVEVLVVVDFEVTIIVSVQTTPVISPDIVILLSIEDAINESIKHPNARVEIFGKNANGYIPTYNYYKNGNYYKNE